MIEQFIFSLLSDEWADGICSITIKKPLEEILAGRDLAPTQIAKRIQEKQNLGDFGLRYMLDITKDLVLAPDIIDGIFSTVCKIATR